LTGRQRRRGSGPRRVHRDRRPRGGEGRGAVRRRAAAVAHHRRGRDRADGDPGAGGPAAAGDRGSAEVLVREVTGKRKGRPSAAHFDQLRSATELAGLAQLLQRAARDNLARDELTTPLLATLEGLAEPALVRTNGEETNDEHPERDTEDETDQESVHDRRPFPPQWGRSL